MRQTLKNIYFSFPIQLLLVHLKKHQLLLVFWAILFLIITKSFGLKFGIPYLFLDPEYLGKVNMLSFLLIGLAFGGFVMTWNVTHYILNSFRFPFLATLEYPFTKYCLNNSLLPLSFLGTYFAMVIGFQSNVEYQLNIKIISELSAFLLGAVIMVTFSLIYFFNTNKDIYKIFGLNKEDFEKPDKPTELEEPDNLEKLWRVDFFLSGLLSTRRVRKVSHYDSSMLRVVFRQHHINAVLIGGIAMLMLFSFSFLMDYKLFRIPAGASLLLLFSILIMLLGAFSFWMRGWKTIGFVAVFMLINAMIHYNLFNYISQAKGINYDSEVKTYTRAQLSKESPPTIIDKDISHTLSILEKWKSKMVAMGNNKPKICFINTSGGGLRAANWTLNVLQNADQVLDQKLLEQTVLISGASAGMIGASYYRELFLRQKQGDIANCIDKQYIQNMSKDILNPICFTFIVNDFFIPWQKFEYNGASYSKDRGYMFEEMINENTNHVMNKNLLDYSIVEQKATIPMAILNATIVNNGQRLYMAAQPISYLTHPISDNPNNSVETDAIDFMTFFKDQQSHNLNYITALRMNASFPYITPPISLPSEPVMKVMDAGMRDNFGLETTTRFIHVFRKWIEENTSGIIILQIRDTPKTKDIKGKKRSSITDKLFNPIGNFYTNWSEFQDYYHDNLITYISTWTDHPVDIVRFEYIPQTTAQEVSLNWHLTTREKNNIINAINSEKNQEAMERLYKLLEK